MPPIDGVWCWYDAGRQGEAWAAYERSAPATGQEMDLLLDGSGARRHLYQRRREGRPVWLGDHQLGVLSFDGRDDYLGAEGERQEFQTFTLFLVAAPRSNSGGFRGLFSANALGKNDYGSGFNLDLGDQGTDQFSVCNVEGHGFGGMQNLLRSARPFGVWSVLEVCGDTGANGLQLVVDGVEEGARDRAPGPLRVDQFALGARCFSNTDDRPAMAGFFHGDIAEAIVYDRALTSVERERVRGYLQHKYQDVAKRVTRLRRGHRLETLTDTPPLQMLRPGFRVRRLPIELTNLNNLRYRADGVLVALAYNGNVHLLRDTDGDGLEDQATLFFEARDRLRGPIGMALTPPGFRHGEGVLVASKGKLSFLVDRDGDDVADEERILATGWQEIPQNVDAVGVALAPDGSVYFGLGCANFANGYLLNEAGQAEYDLQSERGTIQRLEPDWQRRETVCTGMRFPVSLGFNRHGDLFAAEQEGATWLPNGNPFDELLHIIPGRHYGFPPRHPRHLPDVIDEPSTYDYAPQHQSTCGMLFNIPVNSGPTFGPEDWQDAAIVCGESRGKLFLTSLVKTSTGYVARNEVIAALRLLTVDATLSPAGQLVVACHSGPPDWGTGPEGRGELFQVSYAAPETAQPVAVYPASPQTLHIAFDRPLEPDGWQQMIQRVRIEYGSYVRAGDRFETMRPPYAVVERQMATPRFDLSLWSARITPDRRTLELATAPMTLAAEYAVVLPWDHSQSAAPVGVEQQEGIELGFRPTGVAAELRDGQGRPVWSGWLPAADLQVARAWTRGSAHHDLLWERLPGHHGTLTLQGQLDLHQMLQPAIQPGARLDYELPPEQVTVHFVSNRPLRVTTTDQDAVVSTQAPGEVSLQRWSQERKLVPFAVELHCDGSLRETPRLELAWAASPDQRLRPWSPQRTWLPWAEIEEGDEQTERLIPELVSGDWQRGQQLFRDERIGCVKCHQVRGEGGAIGPSLANLVHRDYASVRRDILEPNVTLNPDHLGWNLVTTDGRPLTGVLLRRDPTEIQLGLGDGRVVRLPPAEVESLELATTSVMPANFGELLSEAQLTDLMTYLMTDPVTPQAAEQR